MKYEAVTIVPPRLAQKLTSSRIIDSRAIWSNMGSILGALRRKKVRRDSPTCSSLTDNLPCAIATSRRMKLMTARRTPCFLAEQSEHDQWSQQVHLWWQWCGPCVVSGTRRNCVGTGLQFDTAPFGWFAATSDLTGLM